MDIRAARFLFHGRGAHIVGLRFRLRRNRATSSWQARSGLLRLLLNRLRRVLFHLRVDIRNNRLTLFEVFGSYLRKVERCDTWALARDNQPAGFLQQLGAVVGHVLEILVVLTQS